MITFRTMKPADIDAGLSLCRSAKWNQVSRDWEIFLRLSPDGCRVAVKDDRIVGTVTTVRYQNSFCWIGMVLVDPANQRQGIGIQLLNKALEILKNDDTVKLDATPAGREVYLKLNFVDEYRISRMNAILTMDRIPLSDARPVNKNDLPQMIAFDQPIFGASRSELLEWTWKGAPAYAFIMENESEILGYCLGREGFDYVYIGPVVATELEIAKQLLSAALRNCIGKSVAIDAMHFNKEWIDWLNSIGFAELRPLTRMYRGVNAFPGLPEKQFTILGPEFG